MRQIAATLLLGLVVAGPGYAMPLEEAVRKGIASNPQVRAAQAQEKAAATDVKIAKGGYYPNFSVGAGPRSFGFDDISYDVTVAQMLHDWGRVEGTVDSARAAERKMGEQLRVRIDEAALEVVEVYLDIIVTQRQIAALDEHIAGLERIRGMTVDRSDAGYSDRSEPERADLELARANEQLAIERGTLTNARRQFLLLVGEDASALAEPSPASVSRYTTGKDLTDLILASPTHRVAAADTSVARAELKQAKAALFPQLNLEASTLRRDLGGVARSDTMVALRFRMNGIQGFSNFLRPRGAEQRIEAAIYNEGAIERDTKRDVQTLFDNADLMREREVSLARQAETAATVGTTYVEQFGVGRRDLIDLLNNQREAFEAKRQLIGLRIDRLRVEYRAAAKLGLLGPLVENRLQ
ncbi:MAG: TolC family protein [Sphingobium sp.]